MIYFFNPLFPTGDYCDIINRSRNMKNTGYTMDMKNTNTINSEETICDIQKEPDIQTIQKKQKYLKLFFSTLQLSACTFGGGFVIIPLLRRKFVEELHWIDEQEMMDLTAIAQSSPGAIAVNASIVVGYHVAGIPGAMITVLGTILPPLVIISAISFFYREFRDNVIVNMAMTGMLAGVAAVICDVVITMGKEIFRRKRILPLLVMSASFAAVRFFHMNIILVILICAATGAADTLYHNKNRLKRKGGF